ncbi:MAG: type III PLP-dependent enzyme [Rhizobiales bacterium]|nr:type III PLP-dependent enzyme [Hyphomicrobiales bacterium]
MKTGTVIQFAPPRSEPPSFLDAADVARKLAPDMPVFCFSAAALRGRARLFIDSFPGEVSYAVKANASPDVLATLAETGMTLWDVASIDEMRAVRSVSTEARFHYHNPIKSRFEIREAHVRFDCRRFAVDCLEELDKISEVIGLSSDVEIAVRFVLKRETGSSAHDFSSKFGASETEAAKLLREAADRGYRVVLTFHPGSQCSSPAAYERHILAAHRIADHAGVRLAALNVGGGFPADYPNSPAPPLETFFQAICTSSERAFGPSLKLECEPGRAMVASSHSLLTRIKLIRNGNEIFLNDGIYGALLECAQVPELMPRIRTIRSGKPLQDPDQEYTIYGPTCDPLDVLPGRHRLPVKIKEGDYLEFVPVGAYGAATSTRFNGYGTRDVIPVASWIIGA